MDLKTLHSKLMGPIKLMLMVPLTRRCPVTEFDGARYVPRQGGVCGHVQWFAMSLGSKSLALPVSWLFLARQTRLKLYHNNLLTLYHICMDSFFKIFKAGVKISDRIPFFVQQNGLPTTYVLLSANSLHGLPSGLPSRLTPSYPRVSISNLKAMSRFCPSPSASSASLLPSTRTRLRKVKPHQKTINVEPA